MVTKLLDLIYLGRPMLLIPVWTVYLHFLAAHGDARFLIINPGLNSILSLIVLSLLFKGIYALNQIYDIESDRLNDKLFLLPRNIVSIRTAWLYYFLTSATGLALAIFVSPSIAAIAISLIFLGFVYSHPRFRLKDRPLGGLLANAFSYGLLIPLMIIAESGAPDDSPATIPYFLAIATGYILTTIPDLAGDSATGKKTVAVILKTTGALWLGLLSSLSAAAISIALSNYEMALVSAVAAFLIVKLLISFSNKFMLLACKFPILLLTILAGLHYPLYLVLLLLTIVLTRVYYKKRFGVVYPKMG